VIGHHDKNAMETLRQAAAKKGRTVRIVDQKTVVLPLSEETLASPDRLIAALRSFLAPGRTATRVAGG